jgi:DNA-binding winged helix-turn-helix (wHTH) protein/TolB-like protein/Tfp pilus assembly protein PilF
MAINTRIKKLYRFGEFLVDERNRLLLRGTEAVPVKPKAFELLLVFVENPGTLLEKEELMERVWGNTFVEEGNLARNISSLRKALGEHPKDPEYIVTVAGRGYRFIAQVAEFCNDDPLSTTQERTKADLATENEGVTHFGDRQAPDPGGTPAPLKTGHRTRIRQFTFVVGVVVILLSMALVPNLLRSKNHGKASVLKTIAVLPSKPSEAEDRDPASEFGLAASLISRLATIRSLTVRPAAAILKYASTGQDPIDAGREQQVNYVLASSYRKSGEKVSFTAKLIDVQDGAVLWSDTCESNCSAFYWQDALAEKTTRSLLTALSDEHRLSLTKHSTENQRAYDLYNLALYGWYKNNYDIEGLQKNAEYLQQAVVLDPNYAVAYALLAMINSRVGQSVGAERKEYERKAGEFAHKALELDDTVIQAHLVLGVGAYSYYWDWAKAEEHFKRARELNPDDVEVIRTYAAFLASIGKLDESVFWQRRACDLQPLSADLNAILVKRLFIARRYDETIQQARKALEMVPATPTFYFVWRCYEQQRMYEEAFLSLQQLMRSEDDKDTERLVERTYTASGYEKAREVYLEARLKQLDKQVQRKNFNPLEPAANCALMGKRDDAFKWLEEAYEYRVQGLIYLRVDPDFDSLRSDQRLADLIRRIGFPQ